MQYSLRFSLEELRLHLLRFTSRNCRLFQNLADAFEGNCQRLEVLRLANGAQRVQAPACIHEIVGTRPEDGVHFVIAEAFLLAEDELCALLQEVKNLLLLLGRHLALWRIGMECLRGGGDGIRERERQLLFENDFDDAEASATQGEGIAGAGWNHAYGEAADDGVKLVGKSYGAADQVAWNRIVEAHRAVMVVHRVRDFIGLALRFGVESADDALQLRKLANHLGGEITFCELRGAISIRNVRLRHA